MPRAATRLAKAEAFLMQLSKVSVDEAPAAAIHLAYYAMLHAAMTGFCRMQRKDGGSDAL
jgi:uncharacterized BrkB/YihY/UPF0761 family membrane protein